MRTVASPQVGKAGVDVAAFVVADAPYLGGKRVNFLFRLLQVLS
jgi:hypothetical protein